MTTFCGGLDAARHALREHFGHRSFRIDQLRVIGPLLAGLDVLAVLPTGAGRTETPEASAISGGSRRRENLPNRIPGTLTKRPAFKNAPKGRLTRN